MPPFAVPSLDATVAAGFLVACWGGTRLFSETILITLIGMVPYEIALTAVFMEGFIFVGLTLLGIRQWLAR